ncbi:amidoligase family protein [Veillonella sp. VA139]|uniref:amidoligase family protein n=1 Tax=Veillonella sp. VA139 TaxID=741830 RepID=UPI000F8DE13C|nr:amidoligase family protein [Veillonella sp. VA139]
MEKQFFKINGALYTKKYLAENFKGEQILVLENTENERLIHIPVEELPSPYVPNYIDLVKGQYYKENGAFKCATQPCTMDIAPEDILLDGSGNPIVAGNRYSYNGAVVTIGSDGEIYTPKGRACHIYVCRLQNLAPVANLSALTQEPLTEPVELVTYSATFAVNKFDKEIVQSTASGRWFLKNQVTYFNEFDEEIIHPMDVREGLAEDYFICDCCNEICHVDSARDAYNDEVICEDCSDDQYVWSEAMNTYIYSDDAFYYEDDKEHYDSPVHCECKSQYGWQSEVSGNWWSDNEERYETEDGYYYAEGEQDDLYWCGIEEGWYRYESNMPEGLIRGYHKRPTLKFFGEGPKYFGLELECDGSDAEGSEDDVLAIFDGHMNKFYFNSDGSLSNGFEAITHPMSPAEMLKIDWEQITDEMLERAYDNDRDTAGIHIHISRAFFNSEKNIGRLVRMFSENYSEMVKFAQRPEYRAEHWANRVNGTARQYAVDWYNNARRAGRYTAVNLQNDNTVEIRLFHSLASRQHIMACIQLTDVLTDMANLDRYTFGWDIVNRKAAEKGYEELKEQLLNVGLVHA